VFEVFSLSERMSNLMSQKKAAGREKKLKPFDDLEGKRFKKLVVLHGEVLKDGHRAVPCRCDCGRTVLVNKTNLLLKEGNPRRKPTGSCGCLQREAAARAQSKGPRPPCPHCGGNTVRLGQIGDKQKYLCRQCKKTHRKLINENAASV
jgi:hypothetical protein